MSGGTKAAVMLMCLGEDKINELFEAYDRFAVAEQTVLDGLFSGRKGPHTINDKDRSFFLDSPAYRLLVDSVRELDVDERLELNALGWLGAGLFPDWHRSIDHAETMEENADLSPEYTAGYGLHWRTGYKQVMLEKAKAEEEVG